MLHKNIIPTQKTDIPKNDKLNFIFKLFYIIVNERI